MIGQWRQLCERLGIRDETHCERWFGKIREAYEAPLRSYHNLGHIEHCLRVLDHDRVSPNDCLEVELALWFHDAVYDSKARDNEERSACFASDMLQEMRVSGGVVDQVAQLIRITAHHAKPDTYFESRDPDIRFV